MSGPEFFQTQMGKRFFESTAPRIATALEGLLEVLTKNQQPVAPPVESTRSDLYPTVSDWMDLADEDNMHRLILRAVLDDPAHLAKLGGRRLKQCSDMLNVKFLDSVGYVEALNAITSPDFVATLIKLNEEK